MPLALILSSHVAGSRVGGFAQALALAPFKIDAVVIPTVLYGRHPGWGPPGGAAVPQATFEGMLEGVAANGLFGLTDAVITGYFATAAQVAAAARAIDAIRANPRTGAFSPATRVVVDPTMGDAGKGLYVPAEVADAIAAELVPRADVVAPNAWELERLTGKSVSDPASAVEAARRLGRPTLVSSVIDGDEIGAVYADATQSWFAAHARLPSAPNGTGDLLTALFTAWLIEGKSVSEALRRAVAGVARALAAAKTWSSPELPIVALGGRLRAPRTQVRLERLV